MTESPGKRPCGQTEYQNKLNMLYHHLNGTIYTNMYLITLLEFFLIFNIYGEIQFFYVKIAAFVYCILVHLM